MSASSMAHLAQVLGTRAALHPERVALRFLGDGEHVSQTFSYASLYQQARSVAALLSRRADRGERAVLLYPSGPEYVVAFLGCLLAGVVAVPAYPPASARPRDMARLEGIVRDAKPRLVLTQAELIDALRMLGGAALEAARVELVATNAALPEGADLAPPSLGPEDIAFLQYTSGSTGSPKGVIVTHGNLMANERVIAEAFAMSESDVIVSWLPLFHDMGLIGMLLQPLYSGQSLVLMTPQHFLSRPLRWLQAISRYGGTVSGAPDFAYWLCTERVTDAELGALDLSRWRLAFSGAEPVRWATLRDFQLRFANAGFRAAALYPCYGLAEATLFVTGAQAGGGAQLGRPPGAAEQADAQLVSAGSVRPEHSVEVVDPASGEPLGAGQVGEIWVAGPSVSRGYWQNADATEEAFVSRGGQRFLRTGDLGFLEGEQLFVTGRQKDLIIVRGRNLYPQDLEQTIERGLEGMGQVLRRGRVAAFSLEDGAGESVGIAAELHGKAAAWLDRAALCRRLAALVAQQHGEEPSVVVLVSPGTLPVTSSGKLRRGACRAGWLDGSLEVAASYRRGEGAQGLGEAAAERA